MYNPSGTTRMLPVELIEELTTPPSDTGAPGVQMALVGAPHLLNFFLYSLAIENTELTVGVTHLPWLSTYECKLNTSLKLISSRHAVGFGGFVKNSGQSEKEPDPKFES